MAKKYALPKLDYEISGLEPIITAEMLDVHYNKHHNTYTQNLNNLLLKYEEMEKGGHIDKLANILPAIKFNAGGYFNHSLFWASLAPKERLTQAQPQGALAEMINQQFGSFAKMRDALSAKTIAIQGSGWGWLGWNRDLGRLEIKTTPNQDLLISCGLEPLFCIDVWEHAYYLKYKNDRVSFVKDIWQIINWPKIEEKYNSLL